MKPCFVSPILAEAAKELGVELIVEPRYGYVGRLKRADGTYRYFRSTIFDLNGAGATEIAMDKDYATFFLKQFGYPVPIGEAFFTDRWAKAIKVKRNKKQAWEYAQSIGLPVIVKPNSKSQGSGVARVWNKQEFDAAVKRCSKGERVFLVQKPVIGRDYRIVVLDHEVISAYERLYLSVTGDGQTSIRELLKKKQAHFKLIGRDTLIKADDPRFFIELEHQGMTLESIPEDGKSIRLLSNANLSTGGDAIDVTTEISIAWKALAVNIAREMNLRYIGIDVMLSSGTLADEPSDYVILEVNAAPGLDNYASIGTEQDQIVKGLYKKVIQAMLQ